MGCASSLSVSFWDRIAWTFMERVWMCVYVAKCGKVRWFTQLDEERRRNKKKIIQIKKEEGTRTGGVAAAWALCCYCSSSLYFDFILQLLGFGFWSLRLFVMVTRWTHMARPMGRRVFHFRPAVHHFDFFLTPRWCFSQLPNVPCKRSLCASGQSTPCRCSWCP